MSTETKPITATQSVWIDKQLASIPDIISRHDTYFYNKDQVGALKELHEEINNVFEEIFRKIPSQPTENQ